jgi:5'-3' exonuclease
MGVKDLTKFVRDKHGIALSKVSLSDLKFKKVAIDTAIYIFKFKCSAGSSWLRSFVSMVKLFKTNNVEPIFVFDSQAPPEKLIEQQRRRQVANDRKKTTKYLKDAVELYKLSGEIDESLQKCYDKINTSSVQASDIGIDIALIDDHILSKEKTEISITSEDILNLKHVLRYLNVEYTCAIAEAEATCAYMYHQKDVDYVLTDDSDIMAYGCSYLSKIGPSGICVYTDYPALLESTGLSREEFVDFCIMMGTDYNDRVKGFGPVKCLKTITEFSTLDKITAYHDIDYQNIRRLFSTLPFVKEEVEGNKVEIEFIPKEEFCFTNNLPFHLFQED